MPASSRRALVFDVILTVCLFLPTVPLRQDNRWFLLAIGLCSVTWITKKAPVSSRDYILAAFIILAYINLFVSIAGEGRTAELRDFGVVGIFVTVLVGRSLRPHCVKALVVLIAIEGAVCIVERILGKPSLIAGQVDPSVLKTFYGHEQFWYYSRVFGLSANSSVVAEKLMLGCILGLRVTFSPWRRYLVFACLAGGLIATFNRTVLICTLAFVVTIYGVGLLRKTAPPQKKLAYLFVFILLIAGLFSERGTLFLQFSRGKDVVVDDTGRRQLFSNSISFLAANPLRGNGSVRYQGADTDIGIRTHTHNSYLQVLCDHGAIGILLLLYVGSMVGKNNWKFALPVLLHSMSQCGIFWNISLTDIVLYHLLWAAPTEAALPWMGRTRRMRVFTMARGAAMPELEPVRRG